MIREDIKRLLFKGWPPLSDCPVWAFTACYLAVLFCAFWFSPERQIGKTLDAELPHDADLTLFNNDVPYGRLASDTFKVCNHAEWTPEWLGYHSTEFNVWGYGMTGGMRIVLAYAMATVIFVGPVWILLFGLLAWCLIPGDAWPWIFVSAYAVFAIWCLVVLVMCAIHRNWYDPAYEFWTEALAETFCGGIWVVASGIFIGGLFSKE